ncbi:MAG: globin [Sphingobium sp.]|nr:globin [Sphingobium sp.]
MSLRPQKTVKRPTTPYERIGRRAPVTHLVQRFYDLMESNPAYAELRSIHSDDLTEMRESLTDFLVAWMGGPRDWFDKKPGACIMSAHAAMRGIDEITARQWMDCMTEAAADLAQKDPQLAQSMLTSMQSMGKTMVARAKAAQEAKVATDE